MSQGTETRAGAANSSSPVSHAQLTTRLNKFSSDLTAKLNAAVAEAVESSIQDLKDSLIAIKEEFDNFVSFSQDTIKALNDRIYVLERHAKHQVIWNNTREQRNRSKTFRLHNFRSDETTATGTMKETYNFIVKPAFEAALAAGDLEKVPLLAECGEYGHKLKPRKNNSVPAIVFKFTSRFFFTVFLKHSRVIIEEMNGTRSAPERLRVGRDLTMLNRKVMTYIFNHNMTDKVRLSGTNVQYTLKSDPDAWKTIQDPTSECLADMSKKIDCPWLDKMTPAPADGDDVSQTVVDGFQPAI